MRPGVSRRQFLQNSAALAVGAPTVIAASALGNDKVAAPSNRITLGFIGIGKQATSHLNGLTNRPDTQTLVVCDLHKLRRATAKETVEKIYTDLERKGAKAVDSCEDYRQVLATKDIDAVVIGTPDHWHTIPIIEACKAKKDIYSEKPLTLTIHEAKTLVEAVGAHGRVQQTGSQLRSASKYLVAKELIQGGRIGKIREVKVGLVGGSSVPCDLPAEAPDPNVNFDFWLGQAPERPYNQVLCHKEGNPKDYPFYPGWRSFKEYSGGMLTDFGAHECDQIQNILGKDLSGPDEILPPPDGQTDGFGASFIYHETAFGNNIRVTHVKDPYIDPKSGKPLSRGVLFVGETGSIFCNASTLLADPASILKAEPEFPSIITSVAKALPIHYSNWLDCIRTRKAPTAHIGIGAGSVTVCHLLNLAYWNRRKILWDPKSWTIIGDKEANAWLDRPRRDKYQLPAIS